MTRGKPGSLDVFDCLLLKEIRATGSLTETALRIGLSQPAISIRLNHMRRHFNDPLFVRTSKGMQSTPFLDAILPNVEHAIYLLQPGGGGKKPFDAGLSKRRFRVAFSHVAQMVVLSELAALLASEAPEVQLDSLDLDETSASQLESGELDLAMGYTLNLGAGFYQQRLFTENYLCVVRAGHPRIDRGVSREQFLREKHLALVAPATGHSLIDKLLEERGVERRIAVRVSSFLGMERIITATDLLAIVPARLARTLALGRKVQALELPFLAFSYEVHQYWHQRYHHDPGNHWLRSLIFDHFANLPPVFAGQIEEGITLGGRAARHLGL